MQISMRLLLVLSSICFLSQSLCIRAKHPPSSDSDESLSESDPEDSSSINSLPNKTTGSFSTIQSHIDHIPTPSLILTSIKPTQSGIIEAPLLTAIHHQNVQTPISTILTKNDAKLGDKRNYHEDFPLDMYRGKRSRDNRFPHPAHPFYHNDSDGEDSTDEDENASQPDTTDYLFWIIGLLLLLLILIAIIVIIVIGLMACATVVGGGGGGGNNISRGGSAKTGKQGTLNPPHSMIHMDTYYHGPPPPPYHHHERNITGSQRKREVVLFDASQEYYFKSGRRRASNGPNPMMLPDAAFSVQTLHPVS